MRNAGWRLAALIALLLTGAAAADEPESGLLFKVTADHGAVADLARGEAQPNFIDKVRVIPDGAAGPGLRGDYDQVLAWQAAGNIYAERGTIAFFWRPGPTPAGTTPFPIFRVGYGDHTSWDMVWLRIDWNGHGFDAFVTDTGLSRTRVSFDYPAPKPDAWTHLAFSWDETTGVVLYVNGRPVARKAGPVVLDAQLDQFGPASRIISPHQVQSAYQFRRGGDIDELTIYDHALGDAGAAALAARQAPPPAPAPPAGLADPARRAAWLTRFGWNRPGDAPPLLTATVTTIRKVEFTDAVDVKERMTGANDGIPETTWPGVYNRSRLPGRHDYFELPDWNVYVDGGKAVTFALPDEPWNRLEIQGPADGRLTYIGADGHETPLAVRPAGQARTFNTFAPLRGGRLRFDNRLQETPLQEVAAYDVEPGAVPEGRPTLSYTVRGSAGPDFPATADLRTFINGRFPADERATVVAMPAGALALGPNRPVAGARPIVHLLIPHDFRDMPAGLPVGRFSYGWDALPDGLDGLAIDLPAMKVAAGPDGLIALNIQVKDPLWPARNMMDVSVSVKPGEARTLWLDTRDRMLPPGKSLYLTLASNADGFGPAALEGAKVRLVFKPRQQAMAEHVADRFAEVRDNMAFLVEEHTNSSRLSRFQRLDADLKDLLRVDPGNVRAREYLAEINPEAGWPAFEQPTPPPGVPLWAFRQVEDLKLVHRFVSWWIDERQAPYGDFGGGISDDDDLTQQWPPLALMGVEPDKIDRSLNRLIDAAYRNGMFTNGLSTIETDELHSYEEGANAIAEAAYLDYGDPRMLERLMATTAAYPRITGVNKAGHHHVISALYSGSHVVTEENWAWVRPYSHLILHPGLMLAGYNGDPAMRRLMTDLADGWLAHGKKNADGSWTWPAEINAVTDAGRNPLGPGTNGLNAAMQVFWQAYVFTGDAKYLGPIESVAARDPVAALSVLNPNVIGLLGREDSWGKAILARAAKGDDDPFVLDAAWRLTGDKTWLERLYAGEIQLDSQRMYMVTEGHWWSDRVELFSDSLQRERLGGLALRRNQIVPGNRVSWRFDDPADAERVAILVTDAKPDAFKVETYNLSDRPVTVMMVGGEVAPGQWRVVQRPGGTGAATGVHAFEKGVGVSLTLPPHATTLIDMALQTPGQPVWTRPDLGIGPYDVVRKGSGVSVTVHSLGSVGAAATRVVVEDAQGRVVAAAPLPALAAPEGYRPRTATVRLSLPASASGKLTVRIVTPAGVAEITQRNNTVSLP
jgi:hypothetical protein